MKHVDLMRERWRGEGWFFVRILIGRALFHAVFRPLSFLIAPLLRRANVRVWKLDFPQHIGHLTLEPDCYVKEGLVGLRAPTRRTFLVCRRDRVVNPEILRYWRRYFAVVDSPIAYEAFCALAWRRQLAVNALGYFTIEGATARYPEIYRRYAGRPPLLTLAEADQARGRAALRQIGIPDDAWYICVHCREAGFPGFYDADSHDYRNASITNFAEAMAMVVAAGGWCVRMGDPSMTRLAPAPQVIDYAHHAERSPSLDVSLVAGARFFLGTSSGLLGVAVAFGVPAGLTNQTPMSVVLPVGVTDVGIPKLMWDDEHGRLCTFAEVLGSPAGNFRHQKLYREAGLRPLENDSQDIAALAQEMLGRTAHDFEVTPEDEMLQRAFRRLLAPGHYSYGASSRVGRDFLRRHRDLLGVATDEQADLPQAGSWE